MQSSPQTEVEWQAVRLSGLDSLATRAAKKLKNDELLVPTLAGTRLKMELDRIPLWRGDSVSILQLKEDFARYCYLPRLSDSSTLFRSIEDGVALITWESDAFAYADSFDEAKSRYRGLRGGQRVVVAENGAVIKPDIARSQMDTDSGQTTGEHPTMPGAGVAPAQPGKAGTRAAPGGPAGEQIAARPKRFYGSAKLDPVRAKLSFAEIVDEVVEHFTTQHTSTVKISVEIEVESEAGFSEHVVRTVRENCGHLKFGSAEFEDD